MARLLTLGYENPFELDYLSKKASEIDYIDIASLKNSWSGIHCLRMWGNNNYVYYLTPSNPAELYVGIAMKYVSAPSSSYSFIRAMNTSGGAVGGNYIDVRINGASGPVIATRTGTTLATSGNVSPAVDTWGYYEVWFKPANSSGRVVVKLDGSTVIDYTGDTTDDQAYCSGVYIFMPNYTSQPNYDYFDDFVINDTSGSDNISYPGVIHLMDIRPNSAGNNTDFTRAGVDMGANYDQVSGVDTESWCEGVADDYDLYGVPAPDLPVGATIKNVIVNTFAKSTSGASFVRPMVRSGTTDGEASSSIALGTEFAPKQTAFPLNPSDSAAWEEADLASLEIGVKIKSS